MSRTSDLHGSWRSWDLRTSSRRSYPARINQSQSMRPPMTNIKPGRPPGSRPRTVVVEPAVTVRFAILGDSLAYGQGASRPADTVGARLSRDLTGHGVPNEPRIFAVPGASSADLSAQVDRALAWSPGLALIIIGANDLTRFVAPEQAAAHL